MENYIVSARKYRPSTFSSVVGQKALTATLKNAIATDRLAHAYLFCGSRGVGKTSCARIFAKSINCEHPTPEGDPCNECLSCRAFNENRSLNIVELDAASNNSVDDIRALVEQVQIPPTHGRYRVFIVDEVHMLSTQAFNAFLKTLEEPPSYVVFILATTEKQKIIPTILSRCQIYDFNRITVSDIVDHLEYVAKNEGITTERSALNIIASKADGAMRDALSIFDQVAASSRGNITYASTIANLNVLDAAYYSRLVEAFMASNVNEALLIYKEIRDHGFDSHFFVTGLAAYIRDLMVARTPATLALLDTDDAIKQQMSQLAAKIPIEFFYKAMSLCNDADLNYRNATSKTFLVELLLIKLCQLLSPSPIFDGDGEGHLKPFAVDPKAPMPATPAAAPTTTATASERPAATAPATPTQAATSQAAGASTAAHTAPQATTAPTHVAPAPSQAAPIPAAQRPATTLSAPPRPDGARPGRMLRSTRPAAPDNTAAPSTAAAHTHRSTRFTPEQVDEAWSAFIAAHPKEHVFTNSMRLCPPRQISDTLYGVVTENQLMKNDFQDKLAELLEFIRNRVENDSFDIQLSISDTGPSPRAMNNRELLKYMTENNTGILHAIHALKLGLD